MAVLVSPPCVLHEDDHILVIHKPAGINTHSPAPYAGEGIYEWLKHREPRWSSLAIVHRLDKTTSGVMVFAKSPMANRSLTAQFAEKRVRKTYLLLSSNRPDQRHFTVKTDLTRVGEKYFPRGVGVPAETSFEYVGPSGPYHLLRASPVTGRTHQIRVHARFRNLPILGDSLYDGAAYHRVCLHAQTLSFSHPSSNESVTFTSDVDFAEPASGQLRRLLIEPEQTSAYRVIHGASDGFPGVYIDRWGDYSMVESEREIHGTEWERIEHYTNAGIYHKHLNRHVRRSTIEEAAPVLRSGRAAPAEFVVRENGVSYEISFSQGYSVGLFLDQRDNRRRLLRNYVAADFELFPDGIREKQVLNTFAYTCGFSVCAALAGARVTSLDLSRKYLDWGRRNFRLNKLELEPHDFIYGDVFEWAPRLQKKGRKFDLILLDPPTFSQGAGGKVFQAEKDYGRLVGAVLPMLNFGGVLFASTNARSFEPEKFLNQIRAVAGHSRRTVVQQHYVPQGIDFPISREEPGYLKTAWLRLK